MILLLLGCAPDPIPEATEKVPTSAAISLVDDKGREAFLYDDNLVLLAKSGREPRLFITSGHRVEGG